MFDRYYCGMNTFERISAISCAAVPGVGRATLERVQKSLQKYYVSWSETWQSSLADLSVFGFKEKQAESLVHMREKYSPESYQEILLQKNIHVVFSDEEAYPKLLKEIPDKPFLLFTKGSVDFWDTKPIAIVGTRHITSYGAFVTKKITRELVEQAATIISGFMYGVDEVAHRSAVSSHGKSIGVLGFGFDCLYPRSLLHFSKEFLEAGNTFITEFPPECEPRPGNFPMRNRIVAGLSRTVVVTEAAEKSGSFITVQCALDYNRCVRAVPGPISSIYSDGTRSLINDGAKLVSNGEEILQEAGLSVETKPQITKEIHLQSEIEKEIYSILHNSHATADELYEILKKPLSEVLSTLTLLEMEGIIEKVGEVYHPLPW